MVLIVVFTLMLVPMGACAKFSASICVTVAVSLSAVNTVAWNSRLPRMLLIMPTARRNRHVSAAHARTQQHGSA